jgi:ADP-heptose:LPS heptosyltransferase
VDLQGTLKGALLARLSGAPRRIGLAPGEGGREASHRFATEVVRLPPPPVHRADRALALLRPLGAVPGGAAARPAGVEAAGPWAEERLRALGLRPGGFAVLHPGVSGFAELKRWPAGRWADLARRLRDERGLPVLLTAGPGEEALADEVAAASGGAARRAPATRSLAELGALLQRAAVVVGADTGPVHLAALLGTATVALFGPKDPAVYAPRGPRVGVVWKRIWCSPCRLRRCGDPVCMTEMRVDEVLPAVERALAGAAAP